MFQINSRLIASFFAAMLCMTSYAVAAKGMKPFILGSTGGGSVASKVSDVKTKRAVERDLEIIGEAVNRIRNKDQNIKIENAEKIIGTRNRIIHGYDSVSDDMIWSIVINHLPKLKEEVTQLLHE